LFRPSVRIAYVSADVADRGSATSSGVDRTPYLSRAR
jgi:hypothetical protein